MTEPTNRLPPPRCRHGFLMRVEERDGWKVATPECAACERDGADEPCPWREPS